MKDCEVFINYEVGFMDVFVFYGGKILVVDEVFEIFEGEWLYICIVFLEFLFKDVVFEWFNFVEY